LSIAIRHVVTLAVALALALITQAAFDAAPAKIVFRAASEGPQVYQIFYDAGEDFQQELSVKNYTPGSPETVDIVFDMPPMQLERLRFDIAPQGVVALKSIELRKWFWTRSWRPERIAEVFKPNGDLAFGGIRGGALLLEPQGPDPYMIYLERFVLDQNSFFFQASLKNLALLLFAAAIIMAASVFWTRIRGLLQALGRRMPAWAKRHRAPIGLLATHLLILFVLTPGFFLGARYIYPDLNLKYPQSYPLWQTYATYTGHGPYSDSKSDFLSAFHNRKDFWDGLRQGEWREWNQGHSFGRPLGNMLFTGNQFPLAIMAGALFSPPFAFGLIAVLKHLLAALGMYLFARRFLSTRGAFLAGLIYPLTAFMTVWFMGFAAITAAVMPWLFWALHHLVESERRLSAWIAATAAIIYCLVTAGFVALAGYALYAAGLFYVTLCLSRALSLSGVKRWLQLGVKAAQFAAAAVLGLALTAFAFLPTMRYLGWVDIAYRRENALGALKPTALRQFFNPFAYGDDATVDFIGVANYNESSSYLGGIAVALILIALAGAIWNRKHRLITLFFGGLAALSLCAAFNAFSILEVLSYLPPFNTSLNTRLIALLCFSGAFLAGMGLDRLDEALARFDPAKLRMAGMAFVFLAVVHFLFQIDLNRWLSLTPNPWNALANPVWVVSTLILIAPVLAAMLAAGRKRLGPGLTVALMALAAAELMYYARPQIPTIDKTRFFPETPELAQIAAQLQPYERLLTLDGMFVVNGTERMYGFNIPFGQSLQPERLRALSSRLTAEMWPSPTAPLLHLRRTDFRSPLMTLFGVKLILANPSTDLFKIHGEDLRDRYDLTLNRRGVVRVYENKRYAGPAFVVNQARTAASEEALLDALSSPDFDPTRTAAVEDAPPAPFVSREAGSAPENRVDVLEFDHEQTVYRAFSPHPFILATTETHYPGWEAYADGEPLTLFRVNGLFRGVALPAGEHEVRFVYRPANGAAKLISFLSLLGVAALALMGWMQGRRAAKDAVTRGSGEKTTDRH